MERAANMWGIHNDAFGQRLIDEGILSIGWPEIGDLTSIGNNQTKVKRALAAHHASSKPATLAAWAGNLRRFAFEAATGDIVIFSNRHNRTLNFGRISSGYKYDETETQQPHRRRVTWLHTGVARTLFSQAALNEVGSALTMFAVRNNANEFWDFLEAPDEETFRTRTTSPGADHDDKTRDDTEPAETLAVTAELIEENTRDFVARTLHEELSHEEFEHFTADLLRCLGYQARVTSYSCDGGVDVIAHRDPLGVEPPLIKVQCKHTVMTQGRPEVQRLIGTLDRDEVGLFFTLGTYSGEARTLERERQNLRLFDGSDITDLVLDHYNALPQAWRGRIPLRQVLAVSPDRA